VTRARGARVTRVLGNTPARAKSRFSRAAADGSLVPAGRPVRWRRARPDVVDCGAGPAELGRVAHQASHVAAGDDGTGSHLHEHGPDGRVGAAWNLSAERPAPAWPPLAPETIV